MLWSVHTKLQAASNCPTPTFPLQSMCSVVKRWDWRLSVPTRNLRKKIKCLIHTFGPLRINVVSLTNRSEYIPKEWNQSQLESYRVPTEIAGCVSAARINPTRWFEKYSTLWVSFYVAYYANSRLFSSSTCISPLFCRKVFIFSTWNHGSASAFAEREKLLKGEVAEGRTNGKQSGYAWRCL